jgi:hypothetical protein
MSVLKSRAVAVMSDLAFPFSVVAQRRFLLTDWPVLADQTSPADGG